MASLSSYLRASDRRRLYRVRYIEKKTRKRQSLSFESEGEALQFIKLLDAFDNDEHQAIASHAAQKRRAKTLRDVMLEHIDLLTRPQAGTLARYRNQVRDHFDEALGHTPIDRVGHREVVQWVQRAHQTGLSAKTVKNLHGLLSASMSTAVRLGYRPDNPCVGIELPRSVATEDDALFLSHEEFATLVNAMRPRYQLLLRFLVGTGLRWGEATALTVGDFHRGTPSTVRVTKAWKRDQNNRWYVGPPKTTRSRRTVSLPDGIVDAVAELTVDRAPTDLLFTNANGDQIRHNTFWETNWMPCLEAAMNPTSPDGSPDPDAPRLYRRPRLHDLRHTHASWMIEAGCDLVVLQRRLGHESITTTIDRYSHLTEAQHVDGAAAANRALGL